MKAGAAAAVTAIAPPRQARANTGKSVPVAAGWEYLSASDLVGALANKRISSAELVEDSIARIESLDGSINAVVVRDFERARAAAKLADQALARGERRPLLGLPMTVKEQFDVAGLPKCWGNPEFKDWRPDRDALAVSRLKGAGAILLGKTNVAFMLGDFQTFNDVYGTTNNPWDTSRTPGGSSGGSAAALAAGFVSLELGADLGGSLRVPAHFCGVYAHKPSLDVVPLRGASEPGAPAWPSRGDPLLGNWAVAGPMARSAGDLARALDVLAGPDELSEGVAYKLALPPPRHDNFKGFRVLLVDAHPLCPTAMTVHAAFDGLAERLARSGCAVSRTNALMPDLATTGQIYRQMLLANITQEMSEAEQEQTRSLLRSFVSDKESLAALSMRAMLFDFRSWKRVSDAARGLLQQWRQLFDAVDVVICPVTPVPAFAHDHREQIWKRWVIVDRKAVPYPDVQIWNSIASLAGLPATVAPIGLADSGLPIGAQIIGPYLGDRTTIAFAQMMERDYGGFTPPPRLPVSR
ncbi:MAG TPA: amidase [Stellaceae bacterium]|nr:amidase [Stellaceae bacterium]